MLHSLTQLLITADGVLRKHSQMHEIMGFIWPMMAASAELMIWILIIAALVIIGRGKILPSEKPLVIEREGQYKMNLAAGLNLAQPFIEAIANQVSLREAPHRNELMLYFEVRDKNIASRKQPFYLLKVSLQNGYLSFDASPAQPETTPPDPASLPHDGRSMMEQVENAIHGVAKLWGIGLRRIN